MYSFTDHAPLPNIVSICKCERQYLVEEMYACFNCSYGFCRYCSVEEIHFFYCRSCLENTTSDSDMLGLQEHCKDCLECPNCRTALSITASSDQNNKDKVWFFYFCSHCFWDSKTLGIVTNDLDQLRLNMRLKVAQLAQEGNAEFENIINNFREEFTQMEPMSVQVTKQKKKSISHRHSSINQRKTEGGGGGVARGHWTLNDAEKASQEQEKRILTSMTTLNLDGKKYLPLLKKNSEEGEEEGNINPIYKDLYNDDFPSLDAAMASTVKQEGSMEQRMAHPTIYQLDLQKLYPTPVRLLPKRIRKCKTCMKNIVKPQAGSMISADFQLLTLLAENFPRLRIKTLENLGANKECNIVMNFYNKTNKILHVEIVPFELDRLQTLGSLEYKLVGSNKFSIKSPNILEEDPEKLFSKQNYVEEVNFKVLIPADQGKKLCQFGFNMTCKIEIDIDTIVLQIPIMVRLGYAS